MCTFAHEFVKKAVLWLFYLEIKDIIRDFLNIIH
ncbi:unknown [Prevotella sp. CAG:1058]|nr:unknown [Prevotella sp. CAG:1058]